MIYMTLSFYHDEFTWQYLREQMYYRQLSEYRAIRKQIMDVQYIHARCVGENVPVYGVDGVLCTLSRIVS